MENYFETEWTAMLRHRTALVIALLLLVLGVIPLKLPINNVFSGIV